MTAQHTPGPWRTKFTGTGWTVNYDGPDHNWLVATVNETPYIGKHGPNAALIAAAPELLEALRMLCNIVDHPTATRYECRMIATEARAAIAKATGGKP